MASFLLATSVQKAKKTKHWWNVAFRAKRWLLGNIKVQKILQSLYCVCMLLVQLGIFHWNISMICWATLIFWLKYSYFLLKYFYFLNEIIPFSPILKAAIIAVLVFPFDWVWILWVQLGIFYWNISEEEFDSGFAAGLRDNRWWGWFWKRIWKKFEKIWNILYMYIWHLIEKQLVLLRICERNVSTSADGKSSFGIFLERWNILIEKVTKLKRGKIEGHDTKKCLGKKSSVSLCHFTSCQRIEDVF